jgi:hypothetical protein
MSELIVRASSSSRICTNKPVFNEENFKVAEYELIEACSKKKIIYNPDNLIEYCNIQGIMLKARALEKEYENLRLVELDPLPQGAKTYMQELYLENNYGFYNISLKSDAPQLLKGQVVEDAAIALVGKYYKIDIKKNVGRITKGILSGESDVIYFYDGIKTIRDTKCPQDWKSFRNKSVQDMDNTYYWQLVAYAYLYEAPQAFLDYVLMPTPDELLRKQGEYLSQEDYSKLVSSNESISRLEDSQRIKTLFINNLSKDIEFLLSRLAKCKEYYDTLTYEACMNIY